MEKQHVEHTQEVNQHVKELESRIRMEESARQELASHLAESGQNIARLQDMLEKEKKQERAAALSNDVDELRRQLSSSKDEVSQLQRDKERLKERLEEYKREAEQNEKAVAELDRSRMGLQRELDSLHLKTQASELDTSRRVQAHESEATQLKQQLTRSNEERDLARENLAASQELVGELKATVGELKRELAGREAQIKQLRDRSEEQSKAAAAALDSAEKRAAEHEQAAQKHGRALRAESDAKVELSAKMESMAQLHAESLRRERETIREDPVATRNLAAAEQEIQRLRAELLEALKTDKQPSSQEQALQLQAEQEKAALLRRCEAADQQLAQLRQQLRQNVGGVGMQADAAQSAVLVQQSEAALEWQTRAQELEKQVAALRAELQEQADSARRELQQARRASDALERERDDAVRALRDGRGASAGAPIMLGQDESEKVRKLSAMVDEQTDKLLRQTERMRELEAAKDAVDARVRELERGNGSSHLSQELGLAQERLGEATRELKEQARKVAQLQAAQREKEHASKGEVVRLQEQLASAEADAAKRLAACESQWQKQFTFLQAESERKEDTWRRLQREHTEQLQRHLQDFESSRGGGLGSSFSGGGGEDTRRRVAALELQLDQCRNQLQEAQNAKGGLEAALLRSKQDAMDSALGNRDEADALRRELTEVQSQRRELHLQLAAYENRSDDTHRLQTETEQLKARLAQRRSELLSLLMVLARDVPVPPDVQKTLMGEGAKGEQGEEQRALVFAQAMQLLQQGLAEFGKGDGKLVQLEEELGNRRNECAQHVEELKLAQQQVQSLRAELDKTTKSKSLFAQQLNAAQLELEDLRNELALEAEVLKVQAVQPYKVELEGMRQALKDMQKAHLEELKQRDHHTSRKMSEEEHHRQSMMKLAASSASLGASLSSGGRRLQRSATHDHLRQVTFSDNRGGSSGNSSSSSAVNDSTSTSHSGNSTSGDEIREAMRALLARESGAQRQLEMGLREAEKSLKAATNTLHERRRGIQADSESTYQQPQSFGAGAGASLSRSDLASPPRRSRDSGQQQGFGASRIDAGGDTDLLMAEISDDSILDDLPQGTSPGDAEFRRKKFLARLYESAGMGIGPSSSSYSGAGRDSLSFSQ